MPHFYRGEREVGPHFEKSADPRAYILKDAAAEDEFGADRLAPDPCLEKGKVQGEKGQPVWKSRLHHPTARVQL